MASHLTGCGIHNSQGLGLGKDLVACKGGICSLDQQMYSDLLDLQSQGEKRWVQQGQFRGQPCRVHQQVLQQGFC